MANRVHHLGGGDSGLTTAHLNAVTDLRLSELVKAFGEENARLVWQAGEIALNAVVRKHGIAREFQRVPGFPHGPVEGKGDGNFEEDPRRAGKLAIFAQFDTRTPIVGKRGICFADQAKFHPLRYLVGLAEALVAGDRKNFDQIESAIPDDPALVKCGSQRLRCIFLTCWPRIFRKANSQKLVYGI